MRNGDGASGAVGSSEAGVELDRLTHRGDRHPLVGGVGATQQAGPESRQGGQVLHRVEPGSVCSAGEDRRSGLSI